MTNEKRIEGNKLAKEIEDEVGMLVLARRRVRPHGYYVSGGNTSIHVSEEIEGIIQAIVVAYLENQLAELKAKYEAL